MTTVKAFFKKIFIYIYFRRRKHAAWAGNVSSQGSWTGLINEGHVSWMKNKINHTHDSSPVQQEISTTCLVLNSSSAPYFNSLNSTLCQSYYMLPPGTIPYCWEVYGFTIYGYQNTRTLPLTTCKQCTVKGTEDLAAQV